jgi:hypothetical protein
LHLASIPFLQCFVVIWKPCACRQCEISDREVSWSPTFRQKKGEGSGTHSFVACLEVVHLPTGLRERDPPIGLNYPCHVRSRKTTLHRDLKSRCNQCVDRPARGRMF